MAAYSPREFKALSFHDAAPHFAEGADTPRAYLERCLEAIAAREPVVRAWAALNEAGAREAPQGLRMKSHSLVSCPTRDDLLSRRRGSRAWPSSGWLGISGRSRIPAAAARSSTG
jgi:hypothetical protein